MYLCQINVLEHKGMAHFLEAARLIGMAVKEATSPLFVKSCDEFIYLRPGTGKRRDASKDKPPREKSIPEVAREAAAAFPRVKVIDSRSVSGGHGVLVDRFGRTLENFLPAVLAEPSARLRFVSAETEC